MVKMDALGTLVSCSLVIFFSPSKSKNDSNVGGAFIVEASELQINHYLRRMFWIFRDFLRGWIFSGFRFWGACFCLTKASILQRDFDQLTRSQRNFLTYYYISLNIENKFKFEFCSFLKDLKLDVISCNWNISTFGGKFCWTNALKIVLQNSTC